MKELDIGEVVRRTGLPASALRHYEEKGLIRPVGRNGLRRVFDAGIEERLALIAAGRAAGLSLDEIAGMFAPDGRARIDRTALSRKADEIDATIRKLAAMRDGLRHTAQCRAPNHMECPTFRRILRAAAAATKRRSRSARPRATLGTRTRVR
jgi:DNA-binding transcriptional MerR regulator